MTDKRTVRIEIIFDRDNGTANYGWYARETMADGFSEDTYITEDWAEDVGVDDGTIRAWAMRYYGNPDGMTDAELQELRDRIEVRR